MPFYKITYSEPYRRATVHNSGCNFRCIGCAYKLKGRPKVSQTLAPKEIIEALRPLAIERVHFMGGEPTTNPLLPEVLALCKRELGVRTYLGHTNGSRLIIENLDGTNVSFKAFSAEKHLQYTGQPREAVYDNFRAAFEAGLEMRASCVYIPEHIAEDEITGVVDFIASLSSEIPFHIMGYIPVPGAPWRRPTEEEMERIVALAHERLANVDFSHLTPEQAVDLTARDDRFKVVQVI
ncbi:MAG: radical SAM protein [Candidatus Zipacnadales bacterium]